MSSVVPCEDEMLQQVVHVIVVNILAKIGNSDLQQVDVPVNGFWYGDRDTCEI